MSPATKTTKENYVTMPVFEQSMRAIATSFSDLDERLDARFDAIDGRFNQVDDRFKKIDVRFDAIDQRLARHESIFEHILGELKAIRTEGKEDRLMMKTLLRNDIVQERVMDRLEAKVFGTTIKNC